MENKISCARITQSQTKSILSAMLFPFFVNKINDKKNVMTIPATYIIYLISFYFRYSQWPILVFLISISLGSLNFSFFSEPEN